MERQKSPSREEREKRDADARRSFQRLEAEIKQRRARILAVSNATSFSDGNGTSSNSVGLMQLLSNVGSSNNFRDSTRISTRKSKIMLGSDWQSMSVIDITMESDASRSGSKSSKDGSIDEVTSAQQEPSTTYRYANDRFTGPFDLDAASVASSKEDDDTSINYVDYNGTAVNVENYVRHQIKDESSTWTTEQILTARVLIEEEHPRPINPSLRSLLRTVVKKDAHMSVKGPFQPGDWVEVMGPDLKWKLDMVEKVLPIGDQEEVSYKVGTRGQLRRIELRAPEEALLTLFGSRPWIWQQWALLKVEKLLRFEQGHPHDFEQLDVPRYARYLWRRWIENPGGNSDFLRRLDDPRLASSSDLLFDHIMKPFYFLDEIRREERWDFSDNAFSIFTYMSLLGEGALPFSLFCILLQLVIPALLLLESLEIADYGGWAEGSKPSTLDYLIKTFCVTDDSAQCTRLKVTTLMIGAVQLLYLIQVGPDMAAKFSQLIGAGRFVPEYSLGRVNALRQIVAKKNEDRIGQKIGVLIGKRFV